MHIIANVVFVPSALHAALGIIVMLLSLALIILIHEGGHWLVARLLGFQTPVFSIGFGPRKWSIVLGTFWQTEFRLAPIVAGGYVSLPEMQDETTVKDLAKQQDSGLGQRRFFPVWKRIAVALAGVTFNLISALVMLVVLFVCLGEPSTKIDNTSVNALTTDVTIARDAGFKAGDTFVSVAGKTVVSPDDVIAAFGTSKGRPVTVVVKRGSEDVTINVTPNQAGRIGLTLNVSEHRIFVPVALTKAASDAGRITNLIFSEELKGLGMIIHVVPRPASMPASDLELRGVVGIVQMGASAYGQGLFNFVWYLVMISINLVILNLLPLPVLDGGHVVFFLWEKVSGKPVNAALKGKLYKVFLVLLAGVFLLGLFHDIRHIFLGN
jgi:regulator of sigma E protease